MYKILENKPPKNIRILVFDKRKKEWLIDTRVNPLQKGSEYLSFEKSNSGHITHWQYLPEKP
jgi:hypothetical protein